MPGNEFEELTPVRFFSQFELEKLGLGTSATKTLMFTSLAHSNTFYFRVLKPTDRPNRRLSLDGTK